MKYDYDEFGVNLNNSFNTPPKPKGLLGLLSLAVGAPVTWLEVVLGIVCAVGFYAGLVLALSI
jgi:hypothetical protein